ncbi:MAG: APC family permease [Bradyrhizobium sp.]|uniref:APC family permease n=1 Tax=Bradyrhizobium sp. TaxID=376 RepID=UPI001DB9EC29|nr:APC family permease [Bradyrhizobium sp.]MBV9563034.1 APC family permease [Bradyrhizobium sp.]
MSELRKDSLTFMEALGQSVANVSPTLTPAVAVTVVAAMAGTASWLVYVLATLSLVIVGINVSKLAARISAAGSFFIYVSRALGPSWGMLSGWAMLAAYLFTAMALTAATALFIQDLLTSAGLATAAPPILLFAVISLAVWLFAMRDIRISSRVGLTVEAVSMAIIILVCFISLEDHGFATDTRQLTFDGASFGSVAQAIVFGIFSYVGFESAATLGKETRNPFVAIPRAVILTPIIAGVFFIFTTYVITQGFGDDGAKLGASTGPMTDLVAGKNGMLTVLIYIGATISCFACALASINAFSRMLFSLGRYQFVHRSMGMIHDRHQTPHVAVTIGCVLNFLICSAFYKQAYTDLLGYFGTIASFGFILVYMACSVAAPVLLRKLGTVTTGDYVMGALGAVLMILSLIGSLYPVPDVPYKYFPYGFAVYMLVGVVWFGLLKVRMPQTLLGLEHDMEVS